MTCLAAHKSIGEFGGNETRREGRRRHDLPPALLRQTHYKATSECFNLPGENGSGIVNVNSVGEMKGVCPMRQIWDQIAVAWCRKFHSKTTWPARGHYECLTCQRVYPVPWFEGDRYSRRETAQETYRQTGFVVLALQKSRG